jgi:beta-ribofuranosylaminobenzene 5'-phosphate synthase
VIRFPGIDGEPGIPLREFGGVGIMLDEPRVEVEVVRANAWHAEGPQAERALEFAKLVTQVPHRVSVLACPEQHTGLGVGTALGLAVAKAITQHAGENFTSVELARMVGRGARSAIGVHGFDSPKSFLVEGGKLPGAELSPLVLALDFPAEWKITLHMPEGEESTWAGPRERQAFSSLAELPAISASAMDVLCRLILLGMVPALLEKDLRTFGDAVYEYNARVGELFAPVQCGRYTSPAITAKIHELRAKGIRGVGQSSWGPTVFAMEERG